METIASEGTIEDFERQFFGKEFKDIFVNYLTFKTGSIKSAFVNCVNGLELVFVVVADDYKLREVEGGVYKSLEIMLLDKEIELHLCFGKKELVYKDCFDTNGVQFFDIESRSDPDCMLYILNEKKEIKFLFPNLYWNKEMKAWKAKNPT